jgi:hypothetical protein
VPFNNLSKREDEFTMEILFLRLSSQFQRREIIMNKHTGLQPNLFN